MREMNTLFDSHELSATINMEVDSEEEDMTGDDRRMVDVEYDENRPHAGTGGSSKMRARPTQNFSTSQNGRIV